MLGEGRNKRVRCHDLLREGACDARREQVGSNQASAGTFTGGSALRVNRTVNPEDFTDTICNVLIKFKSSTPLINPFIFKRIAMASEAAAAAPT